MEHHHMMTAISLFIGWVGLIWFLIHRRRVLLDRCDIPKCRNPRALMDWGEAVSMFCEEHGKSGYRWRTKVEGPFEVPVMFEFVEDSHPIVGKLDPDAVINALREGVELNKEEVYEALGMKVPQTENEIFEAGDWVRLEEKHSGGGCTLRQIEQVSGNHVYGRSSIGATHGFLNWYKPALPKKGEHWEMIDCDTCGAVYCNNPVIMVQDWDVAREDDWGNRRRCGCLRPVNFGRGK